jgi:hypothetical protein
MVDEVKDKANMFYLVIVSIVAVVAIVSMVVFFAGRSRYASQASDLSGQSLALGDSKNVAGYQYINPNVYMYYQSAYGNQMEVNPWIYCNMYLANAEQSALQCNKESLQLYINLGSIYCGSLGQSVNSNYYWTHYNSKCMPICNDPEFRKRYPSTCGG